MKTFFFLSLLAGIQAHTMFQKVSVNGVDQGFQFGVRDPDSNYPINSVDDPNFACNTGITHKDSNLITIPQGATVGTFWNHQLGADFIPGDDDSPVAPSHLGPIQVYLASVPDAVSADPNGLQWFKVGAEGFNNGVWAVNNLINNKGWWSFTMPSCVTAGQYLMRVELIALHGAFDVGAAQFYQECAQVQVTGPGSSTPATVSFPGAYSAEDPGIHVSIYDGNGQPTMNGQPYTLPGPPVIDCSGAAAPGKPTTPAAPGEDPSTPATPTPLPNGEPDGSMTIMSSQATPTTMMTKIRTGAPNGAQPTQTAEAPLMAPGGGYGAEAPTGAGSKTPPKPAGNGSGGAGLMEQCAGEGYSGPMGCAAGTCTYANEWFSQCLP